MTAEHTNLQGYWADLPTTAFNDLPEDLIAVLPLGATEQHGPHLPLSVDTDLTDAVLARSLDVLSADQKVLIMPTLTITKSDEHNGFPGTLSLSAETLLAVLRDIAESLNQTGVRHCVLFNGHGGNNAVLEIAARDMRIRHGMIVCTCSWFGFADDSRDFGAGALRHDIHAGDLETSAMLAVRSGQVDMHAAQSFAPAQADWESGSKFIGLTGQAARPAWIAADLNPAGACGDAGAATTEKGEHLINSAARSFAAFLAEFAIFDPAGIS
ncbi:MAG: creatininase family protein [Sulfitobacter sp.]|nr:creatininase family protein [Sulfitobacter sp.]